MGISVKLTIDQQRVVDDWIHQKIEHNTCQLCQSNHWQIGDLLSLTPRDAADHSTGGLVQLVCQNCGHVLLFDVSRIKQWHSVDTTSDLLW
jgi:hypothetical protein